MNTSTIVRNTSAAWLRRGITIVGALLISGVVALGLANHATIKVAPASAPAISLSAGQEHFAALKQTQAELRDARYAPVAVQASGVERFAALKERQMEQHDTTVVPVATQASGRERFAALKQMQAELREAGTH